MFIMTCKTFETVDSVDFAMSNTIYFYATPFACRLEVDIDRHMLRNSDTVFP